MLQGSNFLPKLPSHNRALTARATHGFKLLDLPFVVNVVSSYKSEKEFDKSGSSPLSVYMNDVGHFSHFIAQSESSGHV